MAEQVGAISSTWTTLTMVDGEPVPLPVQRIGWDFEEGALVRFAGLVASAERERLRKYMAMMIDSWTLASDPAGFKKKKTP